MALAATKKHRVLQARNSSEKEILILVNAIAAAINTLCVKLDADAGVTDTNYTALVAAALYQIGDLAGTAITTQ